MKREVYIGISLFIIIIFFSFSSAWPFQKNQEADFSPSTFDAKVTLKLTSHLPFFINLDNEIYICEGNYLSNYNFLVTDAGPEKLTITTRPDNLFIVMPQEVYPPFPQQLELLSRFLLTKENARYNGNGIHPLTISADDTKSLTTKQINVNVIEYNHKPNITLPGVYTVYLQGQPKFFNQQVKVQDDEDGNQNSGNFTFTITFADESNLFKIDNHGVMNFIPSESNIGNYIVTINITDKGIPNPRPEGTIKGNCSSEATGQPITISKTFQLTISNQSTPPNITSYYPKQLAFSASGTSPIYFNLTAEDKESPLLDSYWYVDNTLKEYDSLNDTFYFTQTFDCGISGLHTVKASVTDGIFNTTLQWNLTVQSATCPVPPSSGGGGGGGGSIPKKCNPKWACYTWQECQNAQKNAITSFISLDVYKRIKENCTINNWTDETCGYQTRNCMDITFCNLNQSSQMQECYYTSNPTCNDGIKNCHDGDCELLVDCGGTCSPCPTCNDGTQNQGEAGIDCGGPCPIQCPVEKPFIPVTILIYTFAAILFILIVIAIIKLYRILKKNHEIQKGKFNYKT